MIVRRSKAFVNQSKKLYLIAASTIWLLAKSPRSRINGRGDNSCGVLAGIFQAL